MKRLARALAATHASHKIQGPQAPRETARQEARPSPLERLEREIVGLAESNQLRFIKNLILIEVDRSFISNLSFFLSLFFPFVLLCVEFSLHLFKGGPEKFSPESNMAMLNKQSSKAVLESGAPAFVRPIEHDASVHDGTVIRPECFTLFV